MKVRIFSGRVFALLVCIFAISFLAGFDYAVVNSRNNTVQEERTAEQGMDMEDKSGLTDVPIKDMMINRSR